MFPLSFTWLFSVFFATLVSSDLGLDWDAADLVANHDVDFTWFREDKRDATSWEVLTSPVVQDPLFFNVGQDEFHGDVGIIVFPTSGTYLVQVATDGDPDSPWSYTIGIKPNPHATTKAPGISLPLNTPTPIVKPSLTTSGGGASTVKTSNNAVLSSTKIPIPNTGASSSSTATRTIPISDAFGVSPSTSSGSLPTITQDSDPSSGSSQVTGKTPNAKSNSVKIVLPIVLVILFIVSLLIFWRFRRRRHLPKLQPIQPFSEDRYTVFGVHDDTESQPDIIEHINSHAADSITTHRPYAVLSSSFNSGQITSDVKSDPSLDSDSSPIPPVPSTDGGLLPEAMARIAALEQAQRDAEMQILRLRAENEGWRHNQDSDQASLSTSPPSYYSPP